MEYFMRPVRSTRGRMLSCYERIRLGHYADALRDLAHQILKPRSKDEAQRIREMMDEDEELAAAYKICEHYEKECLRHLGERMHDAAELFDSVSREQCLFESPEPVFYRSLELRLKKAGFELYDILVIKKGDYKEYLMSVRSRNKKLLETEAAARILTDNFREKIVPSMSCPIFISDEFNEYLFESAGRFLILEGQAKVSKDGEACNGDSFSFLRRQGMFFCMLSDGTGVGEAARRDSGHLIDLAENYLESGFYGNCLFGFLEGMLRDHYKENRVPSLDYAEIDLNTGRFRLAKFGSAATFLWHQEKLIRIDPENLLLGYEKISDTVWTEFTLDNGDILILMSDGAADKMAELMMEPDFSECLRNSRYRTAMEISREILDTALLMDENKPHDDMTVLVLKMTLY